MTTSVPAWHRTMRTPATTSTERRAHFLNLVLSCLYLHAHMHFGSSLSLSCHLHVHGHLCGPFTLILPFYFMLYLPPLFLFLNYLKSVVNLHNSCNESMDSTDEFSLSTGYEPKAHDFYETLVDPYVQLLDSPPLFSNKVSSADPDYDDATLEDMLHQVHRAQAWPGGWGPQGMGLTGGGGLARVPNLRVCEHASSGVAHAGGEG